MAVRHDRAEKRYKDEIAILLKRATEAEARLATAMKYCPANCDDGYTGCKSLDRIAELEQDWRLLREALWEALEAWRSRLRKLREARKP